MRTTSAGTRKACDALHHSTRSRDGTAVRSAGAWREGRISSESGVSRRTLVTAPVAGQPHTRCVGLATR